MTRRSVFVVVVEGRSHVTFEDGERVDLAPGVVVRPTAGDRTVWTVTERVRKTCLPRGLDSVSGHSGCIEAYHHRARIARFAP